MRRPATVTLEELKQDPVAHVRAVTRGTDLVVLERKKPVARIVRYEALPEVAPKAKKTVRARPEPNALPADLAELVAAGVLLGPRLSRDPPILRARSPHRLKGNPGLEALLGDRYDD